MRKRIISLLLAIVLVASCFPALKANAAVATQEAAVIQMLKSARFTVTDANTVGSWIDLAYYVGLVLETDNFDPDAVCSGVYFNALRVRSNNLLRQNRVSKIPVYPFVKVSQQPEDLAPAQGEPAVLSVNATASNGTALSYQWYSCADENKTDAVLIEGATEATFTAPTEDFGVFYYFCRLSGTNMEDMDTDVICVDVALPTFEGSLPLSAFEYTVDEQAGTVLLSKYVGTEKSVVVPPFYQIDDAVYATVLDSTTVFYKNTSITNVKLHKGVSFANNTMANLFYTCSSLVSADLSGVNTTGVTDMSSVFKACTKLTTLDMTGIDTSSVTTMYRLFYDCKSLKSLTGYEHWDTRSLQNISGSFNAVSPLKIIDLSHWDLSKIESSRICFQTCKAEQILLPDNLKTINAFFMNHAEYIQGKTFTIPAGVEKIGYDHVFYNFGTSAFEEFIVADGNKNYKAIDGILYSADGKEMLAIPKGKTFENGVYEIPEGVEFLGMLSFSRNPYIKTVVIPNSLELKFVPARDPAYTLPGDNGNINPGNNLNLAIYCEGCSVSSYEVKADNPRYTSRKGVIYSKDMTTLVAIPTWYDQYLDIPEGVTSIAYEASLHGDTRVIAHMGKSTGVSIPSTLTNISPEQLKKLNDLRVKFPDTFKITVSPDNPAYAVDESGALVERDPFILISQQPEDLNPARGDQAILSVGASASNGTTLAYQWYSCTDEDKTDAAPIEGATDATYTVPTDMYGDYYYFCRFSAENAEDVDSDVVCVDVPVMMYKDGLAQPILTYTDASVTTYTNEGSDIVRFCVYVETDYDTDDDGKLDLVKAVVQLPRAAMEGEYDAAVIYEARPYCAGTQNYEPESGTYDVSLLYSTAAPRTVMGTATTAEVAAAANASDFYYYENLDWYDYFLVRGYAVVVAAGPGTKGSEGFETCGSDLEIDAFACVIEWLTGDRVAYTDKTSNIAIEADWCNEQIGMTGRSYAGTTQFGLATTGVEGLETIVPVGGIASWYEYSCSQGMYLRDEGYTNWLAGYCASRKQDTSDWSTVGTKYASYLAQLDKDEEALYGSYGEFWQIRDYTRNAANIQCPALIVHGLNDNNVRTKNFQMMYDAYQTAGADVKLLLFQDGHVTPAYGKNKTEQFINGEAYQQVLNRWFTYHLYDIDNGADDMAAVTVQDNVDGSWDTYDSWETDKSMTMEFSPGKTIKNYASGISSSNYVSMYTAGNTDYSVVQIQEITEDVTIAGTIKVTVTATPQTEGNNQMLTAFLVDMSDTAFNAYRVATGYTDSYHKATGEIFDVGGGAESYTVVKLLPASVKSKIIASGWIDLANPEADFLSNTATGTEDSTIAEHTYNIYLQPNLYTVKAGHKLALVICTRDPSMGGYKNSSAGYNVLISDVEATIPVYPEYTYYSTWDSAITDANNGTIGENADAEKENAVACIYLDNNNVANAVLLRDAETAGMEIAKDMVINLNGHKLSMTEGNITFAIRHTIGTLVVDGTKKGSSIEVKNSDKTAGCIRADAGTLTVNGGTYVATSGKSARPIQVDYDCTATITDCEITAFGGEKTASGGVLNWGIATLTNCRVSAYANYNTDQGEYSMGVYGDGPLILNNCYAYGTHSSVQCHNTLVINGGTYESPGHGVYIACTDRIAHIRNATIRFCEMKEGYIYTKGATGPGLYIGGGSDRNNVTLYIDNCDIYSKTKNAQIILRGTSGEQNNKVYISNSRLHDLGGEKLYVRIDNLTHRLYLGAGNNFNKENTTIKALYDPNSMLPAVIETGETYDSIP